MDDSTASLRAILESAVGKQALPDSFDDSTPLLGGIPDLDSLAVFDVLARIEKQYGCTIADGEVGAEVFETFGSLRRFVESKLV